MLAIQIETVAVGAAIGHACLILAAGKKGRRFAMPHAQSKFHYADTIWRHDLSTLCYSVFFLPPVHLSISFCFLLAMIQQPRLPSTGLMQASDVIIRAEEVYSHSLHWYFYLRRMPILHAFSSKIIHMNCIFSWIFWFHRH